MRIKQINKNQEQMKTEIKKERQAFLSVFFVLFCVFKVGEIQSENKWRDVIALKFFLTELLV